jgi:hypothetical protein
MTPTITPTNTPSVTVSLTPNYTPTPTPTITVTNTLTPTVTPSNTPSLTPNFTPSVTQTCTPTNTPYYTSTPTPTVTPTPSIGIGILFDKSSFNVITKSIYKNALLSAVNRWATYIKIPTARVNAIRTLDPVFNGIYLNNYNEYYNSSSSTIASCSIDSFYSFNNGLKHQLTTGSFNLNINTYFESIYSSQDWFNVLTHELGHALGIGAFWKSTYSIYGSEPPVNYFLNASAYEALSGAYGLCLGSGRPKVALENTGGSGTNSSHWENNYRNSSATGSLGYNYPGLINEVMVGYYSPSLSFKLTPVSLKHLTDYGYEEINPGNSEGYPTLDNSLLADLETSAGEDIKPIIKFEHCNCNHESTALAVFNEDHKPIYIGVISA